MALWQWQAKARARCAPMCIDASHRIVSHRIVARRIDDVVVVPLTAYVGNTARGKRSDRRRRAADETLDARHEAE